MSGYDKDQESLDLFSAAGLPVQSKQRSRPSLDQPVEPASAAKHAVTKRSPRSEVDERFLKDTELAARYGVCRQTIWRWAARQQLPCPVKISEGVTRWRLTDIIACETDKAESARAADQITRAKSANAPGGRT